MAEPMTLTEAQKVLGRELKPATAEEDGYFKANLESIEEYLEDKIILDENKEVFSLDQFLNEEIADYLYNTYGKL